ASAVLAGCRRGFPPLPLHLRRGRDEAGEERMRPRRPRLELRMELAADEPRMLRVLDDLDQLPVGTHAAEAKAVLGELLAIFVRDLVAVTMPLADLRDAVYLGGLGTALQSRRVRTEPHRAAH